MNNRILYLGHEIKKLEFEFQDFHERGSYEYTVRIDDEVFKNVTFESVTDSVQVIIPFELEVIGKGEGSEEESFALIALVNMRFSFLDGQDQVMEDVVDTNRWFFANFSALAAKSLTDAILSHTPLIGVYTPSHPAIVSE